MLRTKEITNINDLAKEITILRSFVIGLAGKDNEGVYRPEFAQKVLKSSFDEPVGSFRNSTEFLSKLYSK